MVELIQLPVWRDNYVYMVRNGDRAFVVDPSDAGPVLAYLNTLPGVVLEAVLNTHHHPDHVGGNLQLVEATGCAVVGAAHDQTRIPGISRMAEIGTSLRVAGLELSVLDVRAHTRGHVAYRCDTPFDRVVRHGHDGVATVVPRLAGRPALFVGDSLFLGGCGRLFEGTAGDLHAVMRCYAEQPPEALVCCAHEYTAANLAFAAHALPNNASIANRLESLAQERAQSGSSVPDTLARELETNPFLLALVAEHAALVAARFDVPAGDTVAVLGALRSAKDRF